MTDLVKRLTDGAKWVEANARYHFQEHQKPDPLRQSLDAAEAMREAVAVIALSTPVQKVQESQTVSEEMVERAHSVIWPATEWNEGEYACRETVRAALTAALEPSHVTE